MKSVPTGDRTRARCVTGAHAAAWPTAVDFTHQGLALLTYVEHIYIYIFFSWYLETLQYLGLIAFRISGCVIDIPLSFTNLLL